jgi:hypothetical protein
MALLSKSIVVFHGTEYDEAGAITVDLACHGFTISKSTKYDSGKIDLTASELVALVERLKTEFPRVFD